MLSKLNYRMSFIGRVSVSFCIGSMIGALSLPMSSFAENCPELINYMIDASGNCIDLSAIVAPTAATGVVGATDELLLATDNSGCVHYFDPNSLQIQGATRSYSTLKLCSFPMELAGIQFHSIRSYSEADCDLRQTKSLVWDFLDADGNVIETQEWIANDGTVGLPPVTESYSRIAAAEIGRVCS